ncbi:hypothetical protein J6590_045863 [Homalodisca vitripennis]|nr:hypothetical protein J6590_045863 [Homalodisca vitripennis]
MTQPWLESILVVLMVMLGHVYHSVSRESDRFRRSQGGPPKQTYVPQQGWKWIGRWRNKTLNVGTSKLGSHSSR